MMEMFIFVLLLPCLCNAIFCDPGGIRYRQRRGNSDTEDQISLCPSLPSATLSKDDLAIKLSSQISAADSDIKKTLEGDKSPGGAVVSIVYKDDIIWTGGYGLKNMSDPSMGAPDSNTGFRIGSISKVFTSLQTLILRDQRYIKSLDDDITAYFPEFKIQNPFQTKRGITFAQLMSHMSGLPRNAPCLGIFETGCNISDATINEHIASLQLMYPPGTQPSYSNLGFGLLGKVLVKIMDSPSWDDLVTKMIIKPLGMQNTGNSFNSSVMDRMAVGYYPDGSEADMIDVGWDASAGQTYSSTADLAKLMTLAFSTDGSSDTQLMDGETVREWMEPAYMYADGTGFSYPWELLPLGNYTLHTKDGVLNGYNAEFQMAAESKVGFILLQSCDGCASHRKIIAIAQQLLLAASGILSAHQAPPKAPPNPQEYVGVYIATIGKVKDVTNITFGMPFGHPTLFTGEGGDTAFLEWHEDDSFQISLRGLSVPCFILHSGHIGAWVYFQRDSAHKIVSLTVPGIAYGHVYMKTN